MAVFSYLYNNQCLFKFEIYVQLYDMFLSSLMKIHTLRSGQISLLIIQIRFFITVIVSILFRIQIE